MKLDAPLPPVKPLDGGLVADHGNHRLTIVWMMLFFDDNIISIQNPVFDHGLARDPENKMLTFRSDHGGGYIDQFVCLYGFDRPACGNATDKGERDRPAGL